VTWLPLYAIVAVAAWAQTAHGETSVRAVLEARGRQFFYAGEPFPLRISIANDGAESVPNPVKAGLLRGFEVTRADGSAIEAGGKADVAEPARPERLSPNSGYFVIVDVARVFPELQKPGQYSIRWTADGLTSDTIVVRMIPQYDPLKEYLARVDTDEGSFTVSFLPRSAPVAVKAFIDTANSGFYDGLTFHKVVPDYYVEGGDRAGDGSGAPPFTYPAELSSAPLVAGTVLLKPASPSPPANGSQFLILLRPEASWTGQATVLGQVIDGLDVVRRISRRPSTQQVEKPHFRPLKPVAIRKLTVTERAPDANPG
jgi:cyclophilin family peptidyl-prolyl cis-trans isomerase